VHAGQLNKLKSSPLCPRICHYSLKDGKLHFKGSSNQITVTHTRSKNWSQNDCMQASIA